MKAWQRYGRAVAIGYGLTVVLAAFGQRWLLYPRPEPDRFQERGEVFRVPFAGGDVPLWYVQNDDAEAPLIAWFHGNAETASGQAQLLDGLVKRGVSFAAAEYPGYGLSTGVGPSEAAILDAARATMKVLATKSDRIVCGGGSLGTGVAAAMAAEGYCWRLELISPYTSLPAVAQAVMPWLPARFLVLDQFDTASRAAAILVPTLIFHGTEDETCPVEMGRSLGADISGATFVELPGRSHNNMLDRDVFDRLAAFAKGSVDARTEVVAAPPPNSKVGLHVDLHVDTPTQMVRRGVGLDDPALESGLDDMKAGGTNVVVEVLWPPKDPATPAAWTAQVERLFAKVEAEDKRLPDVEIARSPDDAQRITGEGHVAMLVSIEGAHGIDHGEPIASELANLARLQARGLSLIELTWTFSNRFAGSSGDAPAGQPGAGLTDDGRALVDEANRLGLVVDVSHASDAATLETCNRSKAPVIASHSNADGVRVQPRNLSDEAIRCIGERGGVVGLNFHATFVGPEADVAKVADHADYLKRVGGVGIVALGSDYDGLIKTPAGLSDAGDLPALWAELTRRGWTEDELRGVQGENFMRAWEAVIAGAGS